MPNIAEVLKSEIVRLSRKAVRQSLRSVQSASVAQRQQLAVLKKQVSALEREIAALRRSANSRKAEAAPAEGTSIRFVAKGLRSLRSRLGLGAKEFGLLVGVSAQSVYNWEAEKTVPRPSQVAVIASLRSLGKKEARARLEKMVHLSTD